MAMDLEDSIALLNERTDLEGYLIYLDEAAIPAAYMTKGFERLLVN